jgi:hypothetical protein
MIFKQLDVALAHHSGGPEDADWVFISHGLEHSSVQECDMTPASFRQFGTRTNAAGPMTPYAPSAQAEFG